MELQAKKLIMVRSICPFHIKEKTDIKTQEPTVYW